MTTHTNAVSAANARYVRVATRMNAFKLTHRRNRTHAVSAVNALVGVATYMNIFKLTHWKTIHMQSVQ